MAKKIFIGEKEKIIEQVQKWLEDKIEDRYKDTEIIVELLENN